MTKKTADLLKAVTIKPAPESHIRIDDKNICRTECEKKYCTKFCPTNVFTWSTKEEKISIHYKQCIECLACPFGCPYHNISWTFPPSGYGVEY